jgi:hypothetical protein
MKTPLLTEALHLVEDGLYLIETRLNDLNEQVGRPEREINLLEQLEQIQKRQREILSALAGPATSGSSPARRSRTREAA